MIQLVAQDREFNVFPVGTYLKNRKLVLDIPNKILEDIHGKEENYIKMEIYGGVYVINFNQLNKVKSDEFYIRKIS